MWPYLRPPWTDSYQIWAVEVFLSHSNDKRYSKWWNALKKNCDVITSGSLMSKKKLCDAFASHLLRLVCNRPWLPLQLIVWNQRTKFTKPRQYTAWSGGWCMQRKHILLTFLWKSDTNMLKQGSENLKSNTTILLGQMVLDENNILHVWINNPLLAYSWTS